MTTLFQASARSVLGSLEPRMYRRNPNRHVDSHSAQPPRPSIPAGGGNTAVNANVFRPESSLKAASESLLSAMIHRMGGGEGTLLGRSVDIYV